MNPHDAPMILPSHNPVTGEVEQNTITDYRIPYGFDAESTATIVGFHHPSERCPAGRHLFDAIHTQQETDTEDTEEQEPVKYQLCLTCVRCGLIQAITGTVAENETFQVIPDPIRSGPLQAQQIHDAGQGLEAWAVFQDAQIGPGTTLREHRQIGLIRWARGERMRRFFTGQFHTWPPGRYVEAATAHAVLHKLSEAYDLEAPNH